MQESLFSDIAWWHFWPGDDGSWESVKQLSGMFNVDVIPPAPGTADEKLKSPKTLYKWGQQDVGIYRTS